MNPFAPPQHRQARYLLRFGLSALLLSCAVVFEVSFAFAQEKELTGNCLVIGNGPERYAIEALGKKFEELHPKANIDFFWHQSARPVEEVERGDADIAVTGKLEDKLPSTIIAWDGVAVVTNFANPIGAISSDQLKQIFEGKLKYWSQVYEEGPETRIRIIHRTWNQNIRQTFEQYLKLDTTQKVRAKIVEEEQQTFKSLNGDIYAISYVSMGPALQARKDGYGVTLLFIDEIEPEYQTVLDATYPIRRPVVFVMKKEQNPVAKAFLEYVLSPAGQRAIKSGGSGLFQDRNSTVIKYYPLKGQ